MAGIFDALTIRSATFRNRLVVSPMCMYSSKDGHATDFHLVHLGQFALGGFGLVIAEATAIDPRGRISPDDAGLWTDSQIEPLRRITSFLKEHGAVPGIQLGHAGRKASTARQWGHPQRGKPLTEAEGGWPVVGPSPVAFDEGYQVPHELTVEEIHALTAAFAASAKRALAAGYQVIELHAAHGYLLNEFLSPLSNKRTDAYGGSFENRARFLLEVTAAVREVWPAELPLFVRLSATDWVEGGWTLEDSVALAKKLKGAGVDVIDCSSASVVPHVKIPVGPGYQVPLAEGVRTGAGIMTGAVGMVTEYGQAAEIVAEGKADLVLLARQALREPAFPRNAAKALGIKGGVVPPGQYERV